MDRVAAGQGRRIKAPFAEAGRPEELSRLMDAIPMPQQEKRAGQGVLGGQRSCRCHAREAMTGALPSIPGLPHQISTIKKMPPEYSSGGILI
jgi:hypothetical protein